MYEGFFVNYAADKSMPPMRTQYRVVQAVPLIPVGLAFIASFFLAESPRWLASQDRPQEARSTLAKLRGLDINDPLVSREFEGLEARMQENHQALKGISTRMIIKEIWSAQSCRNRFLLSAFMQTVAQWSGGNGITYYIVTVRLPPLFPPTHPSNHPCIPEYAFTNMCTDIPIRRPPRLVNLHPILRRIRPHKAPLHRPLRPPPNRPPGPP
jgi:hypothetical protein